MLEKDIENLLAQHVNEFLPDRKLKLVGQQVQLGSYRADLVFQEGPNEKLVIEVKRGLLMREAVGQIGVYYGLLRQSNPKEEIKIMLVANAIPKEMTIFLEEKMGIEFLEIPVSKINEVAKKYTYSFGDLISIEEKTKNIKIVKDLEIKKDVSGVWIFQANPYRFDIINALADERLNEDVWMVSQHKDYIKQNDIALIWMSGKEAGIYAIADITSNPELLIESPISAKYWTGEQDKMQKRLRVKYRYKLKFPSDPIYRQQLKNIPELLNMAIFKQAQGTNFSVTCDEWKVISSIIKKRFA